MIKATVCSAPRGFLNRRGRMQASHQRRPRSHISAVWVVPEPQAPHHPRPRRGTRSQVQPRPARPRKRRPGWRRRLVGTGCPWAGEPTQGELHTAENCSGGARPPCSAPERGAPAQPPPPPEGGGSRCRRLRAPGPASARRAGPGIPLW